jgi:two-component system response regulator BaeR
MSMKSQANILIVEDDRIQAEILSAAVRELGYSPLHQPRASGTLALVRTHKPEAVLLDLGLPDGHGFELCRSLRSISNVPVMIITAQGDPLDQIFGLELGADDYIVKPIDLKQVMARLKALLRRAQNRFAPAHQVVFDDASMLAQWHGQELALTRIEYQLLRRLAQRPGQVLSRAQLLDALYDADRSINDRTIDSHIRNLRKKLQAVHQSQNEPEPIESVYGMGYRFVASEPGA